MFSFVDRHTSTLTHLVQPGCFLHVDLQLLSQAHILPHQRITLSRVTVGHDGSGGGDDAIVRPLG